MSASGSRPANVDRVHEPADAHRIPPYAVHASGAASPAMRHGVKTSATSRFIWGALASTAPARAALRNVDGQPRD